MQLTPPLAHTASGTQEADTLRSVHTALHTARATAVRFLLLRAAVAEDTVRGEDVAEDTRAAVGVLDATAAAALTAARAAAIALETRQCAAAAPAFAATDEATRLHLLVRRCCGQACPSDAAALRSLAAEQQGS